MLTISKPTWQLTKRETEILYLIAQEYSNKEIAEQLHISVGTVEAHRRNLFLKSGATNMAGLIHRSYKYGILSVDGGMLASSSGMY